MADQSSTSRLDVLLKAAQRFLSCSVSFLVICVLLRLYEAYVLPAAFHFPGGNSQLLSAGLLFDMNVFLYFCALAVIPFALLYLARPALAEVTYLVAFCIYAVAQLALQAYFAHARVPLGADLFAYSWSEVTLTMGASGGVSFTAFIPFVLCLLATAGAWLLLRKRTFPSWVFYPFYITMAVLVLVPNMSLPDNDSYETDFDAYVACNKLGFFAAKSGEYLLNANERRHLARNIDARQLATGTDAGQEFKYLSQEFPLLHTDETPDVLGNYFGQMPAAPRFVFIIVESLGRAYSGPDALLGSFTPFLDSLAGQSLYWENCLSTSGRTFAVLPSMFASLPFGDKGFAEMGTAMPQHISLISLLKERGYDSRFIYGGDAHFDNMDIFLERQGVTDVVDSKTFGPGYTRLPASDKGFTWGYGDKEILGKLLEGWSGGDKTPRLDIALTLAMHSPFRVTNQERYEQLFEGRMNHLQLPDKVKAERRMYKSQFATIMYFDDALRQFFKECSAMPGFENTIFVITGDHRMPEIPISTQIDRFHVPLVLYSPMLKRAARFSSISSQFDLTPSIIALLKHRCGMRFPRSVPWLGNGLDTTRQFQNTHSYPLMRNKNELVDYLDGEFFLSNGKLYRIYPNMDIEPADDARQKATMEGKLERFKMTNTYVCSSNKIIPDTVYRDTFSSTVAISAGSKGGMAKACDSAVNPNPAR